MKQLLFTIKQIFADRIYSVYYWVRHRTVDKYHVIYTGLRPGYCDKDRQMLYGMFNLLVDFVEGELAWMQIVCSDSIKIPWYMTKTQYRDKHGEGLGVEYLEWAMTLKDDDGNPLADVKHSQAWGAKEIMELYMWWKYDRPNRRLPYDCVAIKDRFSVDEWLKGGNPTMDKMLKSSFEIEQGYDKEDEEMLIRLVKVRQHLWT